MGNYSFYHLTEEDHLDIAHDFDCDFLEDEWRYVGTESALMNVAEFIAKNYGYYGYQVRPLVEGKNEIFVLDL